jgi:hypothetical protein
MSAAPENPLLAQLGIAAEDLNVVAHVPAPKGSVARGLAGPLPSPRDLSDTFAEMRVEAGVADRWPFLLTRHTGEPGVVRIEDGPEPARLAGAASFFEGAVLLDGRPGQESACVLEVEGALFVVQVGPDGVTVREGRRAPAWVPSPDRLEVPAPSLDDLLAGRACADWLRRRSEQLAASPSIVEQAASVGVVVRLWEPAPADRDAILAGKAMDPAQRAASWMGALGASRIALQHLIFERAADLRAAFDALPRREEEPTDEEVLSLAHERDVLESARVLLSFVGMGLPPARALALTDDVAATTWSAIAPSDRLRNDPLLRAVFACEPESLWGQLAEV